MASRKNEELIRLATKIAIVIAIGVVLYFVFKKVKALWQKEFAPDGDGTNFLKDIPLIGDLFDKAADQPETAKTPPVKKRPAKRKVVKTVISKIDDSYKLDKGAVKDSIKNALNTAAAFGFPFPGSTQPAKNILPPNEGL